MGLWLILIRAGHD